MTLTRRLRLRYVLPLAASLGAVAWLVAGPLRSNIEYFRTPTEALAALADGEDGRFRLAGEVVTGSVEETADGVTFDVTDGANTVSVIHRGSPPELFGDEVPVVCEGRWAKAGATFESDRILIRHGNEYRPPEVTTTSGPAS
ncbi:MAG: cytochrome c maturation protein CcmE [Actinobacteria bacterium]|nr:cytochrome c maturation protein CcmE [Actinomycetota bacterium]